ncbi:hypothetical protein [Hydrogenophaga atypica]|uniref:Uncharacterized protein n=1 Tax=Hydrogenophaga atypica TaxID=249409 RepID=A0ABW2QQS7_9BURK
MTRLLAFSVFAGLLASSAHAVSFSDCIEYSSEINKFFPQRIDKLTTVTGTTCVPGRKKPSLMYRMRMDIKKSEADLSKKQELIDTQLKSWCSDPRQIELFKRLDIKYAYVDSSGDFIFETHLAIESCPR